MDLIQSYHDQESQSSSSGDEARFSQKIAEPSTSYGKGIPMPKMVSNFEPLERIPIDRLMLATAVIAAEKPTNQKQKQAATGFSLWISDVEKEIRMCLGSVQVIQKHTILESMDRFASKLTKDYEKIIKPSTAESIAHYIRTYFHIYKYLFRSLEKGKRYYKRFIKILAIYTDLELCASIRGAEYDNSIAERIVLIYQTYLDHSDNSMVLDVLLNTKRLWRQHRGILVLLFEYFLVRKTPIELPDTSFMKNLIMFKKWLYLEEVPEERQKARDAFVRFVKPKKTICMNSLFKPYLPVDEEGFVTIDNSIDILNKEYSLSPLIRLLKKAEVYLEVQQNDEVIVLTDDENDSDHDDQEASSSTYSHQDDISNDFDWHSAISQQDHQLSHSQKIIETVSIDSPPPNKKAPSCSSLDSCDLNMDTSNSNNNVTNRNGESAQHSDCETEMQQSKNEMPSNSKTTVQEVNGEIIRNLSTLNESVFNQLVNDINSTHVSVPGTANTSNDVTTSDNIKPTQTLDRNEFVNCLEECRTEEREKPNNMTAASEHLNGIMPDLTKPMLCPTNGSTSMSTSSGDHNMDVDNEMPSNVLHNHVDRKLNEEPESVKKCDNNIIVISSSSSLKNHEETLKNIDEIVTDDLKHHKKPSKNIDTASSPIHELREVEMESNTENEKIETTEQANLPHDWIPAAESTSVINETSLLTKSEQEVLFKDRDALIFTDLLSNGPTNEESPNLEGNKTSRLSSDSPITFLQNGFGSNFTLKTYGRIKRPIETKTISTQTSSACTSPITIMEAGNSRQKDNYLLTEKDDDELFLRDIFNTTDSEARSGDSPRIRSPVYPSSTPASSTPIASTSSAILMGYESIQSSVNSSGFTGSAEVVVKRKRGRPRKYPLPEPGATPVPKPPKAPRKPRQPRQPKVRKEPKDNAAVEVFEKRVLRERKPKPVQPEPKEKSQTESPPKSKRSRRRNTIKMTIDAIFNTQSPQFRYTAIQARRISQILGINIDSPRLATILKRRNYNKSIIQNISSINETINSSLNDSSMLQTFQNRTNGEINSTSESNSQQNTQSTILARKSYIKPNITLSSLSSALRRISFSSRRISFNTRRISFNSSIRQNRTNSSKKTHSQRYTKIDIFDTSKKRGRKKGTKDSAPRKRSSRKNDKVEIKQNITAEITNPITEVDNKINESGDIVDRKNDLTPLELNNTNEMNKQFANIHVALSSTQHIHNDSEYLAIKRRNFLSEDTETDFTNELTTDPESTVEDTDDSHTRKSKRSRKRPKILDL